MKAANPKVVPNVFVQQACLGSHHNAEGLWVKRMDALNGFAPYEAWDHPELLLTEAQREANPALGPLTLATTRALIVRAVKPQARQRNTITPLHVGTIGDLPYAVRDEDPAAAPVPDPTLMSDVARRFHFTTTGARRRPSNGHRRVGVIDSMLLTERQRQKSRHRGRPRSSAFRSRG